MIADTTTIDPVALVTAIGACIAALTGLVAAVGVLLSKLRGDRIEKNQAENKMGMQKQDAVLDTVKQQVNGQMEHVLETKAIVADKLAVATDKLATITQSTADIKAAVLGAVIATEAKEALDDHRGTTAMSAVAVKGFPVALLAALCLTLWGCGESRQSSYSSDAVSGGSEKHQCYIDKNGNQICK